MDAKPPRHVQKIGPRVEALLDDAQDFGNAGLHGRGGQRIRNLRRFHQQRCLGPVDGGQRIGHRDPDRGDRHGDKDKIMKAPHETRQIKFEIEIHYA